MNDPNPHDRGKPERDPDTAGKIILGVTFSILGGIVAAVGIAALVILAVVGLVLYSCSTH